MNEKVIDRLRRFMESQNIKPAQLERTVGAPNGYLRKVSDTPKKYLGQIYASYPDLNRVWLLSGEGHMLYSEQDSPKGTGEGFASEEIEDYGDNKRVTDLLNHINILQSQLNKKDEQINKLLTILTNGREN